VRGALLRVSLRSSNLSRALLQECRLTETSWPQAVFVQTRLYGLERCPDFTDSDITMLVGASCDMAGIRLTRVTSRLLNLRGCRLTGLAAQDSDLTQLLAMRSDLSGASFSHCALGLAAFSGSALAGASFSDCEAEAAHLDNCDLGASVWNNVNLKTANLSNSDLSGARLTRVNLVMADLSHAEFRHAALHNVDLTLANSHAADLRQADLRDCKTENMRLTDPSLLAAEQFSV
jgi:uncharacterized protein YjbI with pentapeptide repeats